MQDLSGKIDNAGPPDGQLTADEWNDLFAELSNFLIWAGLSFNAGDDSQLGKSVLQLASTADYYSASGTGNAHTLTILGRPGATAYHQGLRVRWEPPAGNTGATTINVNSLGVKDLRRPDGTVLQSGDLVAGRMVEAYYDSTLFKLTSGSIVAAAQALPPDYISGLVFTPATGDLTHDITVAVGRARDASNLANLTLSGALTKRFDGATIAVGTGQTGFPTTSLTRAASTWYRVFLVGHTDGRTDIGFDTSATAANLLADLASVDTAGWTYYRQLGWVRTTSGDATAFVPFVQYAAQPGRFHWIDGNQLIGAGSALVTTRTARDLSTLVPPQAVAHIEVFVEPPSGASSQRRNLLLTDTDQADYAPSDNRFTLTTKSAGGAGNNAWTPIGRAMVRVDGSSQVYERWDAASSWERTLMIPCWDFAR